jgi:hypothetical protein
MQNLTKYSKNTIKEEHKIANLFKKIKCSLDNINERIDNIDTSGGGGDCDNNCSNNCICEPFDPTELQEQITTNSGAITINSGAISELQDKVDNLEEVSGAGIDLTFASPDNSIIGGFTQQHLSLQTSQTMSVGLLDVMHKTSPVMEHIEIYSNGEWFDVEAFEYGLTHAIEDPEDSTKRLNVVAKMTMYLTFQFVPIDVNNFDINELEINVKLKADNEDVIVQNVELSRVLSPLLDNKYCLTFEAEMYGSDGLTDNSNAIIIPQIQIIQHSPQLQVAFLTKPSYWLIHDWYSKLIPRDTTPLLVAWTSPDDLAENIEDLEQIIFAFNANIFLNPEFDTALPVATVRNIRTNATIQVFSNDVVIENNLLKFGFDVDKNFTNDEFSVTVQKDVFIRASGMTNENHTINFITKGEMGMYIAWGEFAYDGGFIAGATYFLNIYKNNNGVMGGIVANVGSSFGLDFEEKYVPEIARMWFGVVGWQTSPNNNKLTFSKLTEISHSFVGQLGDGTTSYNFEFPVLTTMSAQCFHNLSFFRGKLTFGKLVLDGGWLHDGFLSFNNHLHTSRPITLRLEAPQIRTNLNSMFNYRNTPTDVDLEIHKDSAAVNVANRTWAGKTFKSIQLLNDDGSYV